ncbi:hypothetical protein BDV06DRAFT_225486 [Aspergillus oleicola]
MEHLRQEQTTNPNICLSGGAAGADLEWGRCASLSNHGVIHWSFPGYKTTAPEYQVIRLSDEETSIATDALASAAKVLGKTPPKKPTISRLLRRNYFQVAWATCCYAVTVFRDAEEGEKVGGTAWAMVMFSLLHPGSRELYVFDMERDEWLQWHPNGNPDGDGEGMGEWVPIKSPPRPSGVWAGIGSRGSKGNGRDAIRRLMGCLDVEE